MSIRRFIHRAGASARGALRRSLMTERERLVETWHGARGDTTLRLDFPLDSSSVVADVGGYEGQWASDIFARFRCRIHVYEPMPAYAELIERRFAANSDVVVHRYGLAASNREQLLHVAGDESSLLTKVDGKADVQIRLESAVDELARIGPVSLLKLNIEGAEYEVLEALTESGTISHVQFLLIQFHDFVPQATQRRDRIASRLRATHEKLWDYPFVWEAWSRLESSG